MPFLNTPCCSSRGSVPPAPHVLNFSITFWRCLQHFPNSTPAHLFFSANSNWPFSYPRFDPLTLSQISEIGACPFSLLPYFFFLVHPSPGSLNPFVLPSFFLYAWIMELPPEASSPVSFLFPPPVSTHRKRCGIVFFPLFIPHHRWTLSRTPLCMSAH